MKNTKISKGLRLIAFFLVAIILVCAFGFSADGWQIDKNDKTEPQSGGTSSPPEQNPDKENEGDSSENNAPPITKRYYNRLTGEETTKELAYSEYISFVINTSMPMYGLAYADISIEFPIETGGTRFLAFVNTAANIPKIGSLSETRRYISNLSKAFDSRILSNGNDDSVDYPFCHIDDTLTKPENISGNIYREFGKYTYTSGYLLRDVVSSYDETDENLELEYAFKFTDASQSLKSDSYFNKITIPYSDVSETTLIYSTDSSGYLLEKNGTLIKDMTNAEQAIYKNCFVLFADSAIYESQSSTQLVLNTMGQGSGYYFTEGSAMQISWILSEDGSFKLYDKDLNELTINRGKSFISFFKSSMIETIILSQ